MVHGGMMQRGAASSEMPPPFHRVLQVTQPPVSGDDVVIMQHLIQRAGVPIELTGVYDAQSSVAVATFARNRCQAAPQQVQELEQQQEEFTALVARCLLRLELQDGWQDPLPSRVPEPYLYKVFVRLHANRSIESTAYLILRANQDLGPALAFRVRGRGQDVPGLPGVPLNQLSANGNTPSGLMEFDLNSPEGNASLYGPYPVNRVVRGLAGNAAFLLRNSRNATIRSGILLHTGEWSGWAPPAPMPNSHGCLHAWPADIKQIWTLLVQAGVKVRPNSQGKLPYQYHPQGLLSIETIP